MYGESVFFIGANDASSSASLLFAPERVLSLHDARRERAFEEGRDFEVRRLERTMPRVQRLPGRQRDRKEKAGREHDKRDSSHRGIVVGRTAPVEHPR